MAEFAIYEFLDRALFTKLIENMQIGEAGDAQIKKETIVKHLCCDSDSNL